MANATITFTIFGKDFVMNPSRYFTVFGIDIHWYGVIIAFGMLCGVWYAMRRSKQFGLTEDNIIDMLLIVLPLGVIGSRLLYVMFNFDMYKNNLAGVFKIWEGGLAIYGGIVLAIFGLYFYCKRKKLPFSVFLDVAVLALIIAQSIGRWGNFINREVYGTTTTLPWAMKLTLNGNVQSVHPLFLYESLWNAVGFVFLHFYSKKRKYDGEIFAMYAFWYGLARYMFEQIRQDSVLYLFNTGIRVSQIIGLISFGAALIFLLNRAIKKNYGPLYVDVLVNMDMTEEMAEADEYDEYEMSEETKENQQNVPEDGYINDTEKDNQK